MRKNKLVAFGLVAAMAISLTACGGNKESGTTPTDIPTEAPTAEATPTATPTAEPTKAPVDVNAQMEEIHQAVKDVFGEEYVPSMPYDETYVKEVLGVDADWYDVIVAEGPMISVHVDTFVAIHPTEGNLENVQNALTSYQETLKADLMQYPSNLLKIQGSRVETVGDYVFFIMLGFIDNSAYEEEEDAIAAYAELNQKAVDAIKEVVGE